MRTETIYNPDARRSLIEPGDIRPRFTHFTVEHSDPLKFSEHPIINKLIESRWEVCTTYTEFFMGFPTRPTIFTGHFVSEQRHEFEIRVPNGCWLRFRFDGPDSIYLTLFYVHYERQGQGLGKKWFPKLTDALFRAGVKYMRGAVSPAHYRSKWPMDVERLTRFYLKQDFGTFGDGYIWKCSPYEDFGDPEGFDESEDDSPNSQDTETRNASEMATVS